MKIIFKQTYDVLVYVDAPDEMTDAELAVWAKANADKGFTFVTTSNGHGDDCILHQGTDVEHLDGSPIVEL